MIPNKQTKLNLAILLLAAALSMAAVSYAAPMGTAFNYQGSLNDAGSLADGLYDFQFKVYDALAGGTQQGSTLSVDDKDVIDGFFTVTLDFGAGVFTGDARWLQIAVRPGASAEVFTTLSPRQKVTPAPHALALPGLWTQQNATSANLIGGYSGNSVASGVVAATIAGGGDSTRPNKVTDNYGTVGGGGDNQAGDNAGTATDATYATVGGGLGNKASVEFATVGGGYDNTAGLRLSDPPPEGDLPFGPSYATVGGGQGNSAKGPWATIGGGRDNTASERVICSEGGCGYSFYATVGGGLSNTARDSYSTVGGGKNNTAGGALATVGGGELNTAWGVYATVPGGYQNAAGGALSFAAGYRAKANHTGTFVWADSTNADFQSTGPDQFLIRASGGVGIGTTNTSGFNLAVNGSAAKPGGGSWSVYCDRRLKKNIEPLAGTLDRMLQLKGVRFEYSDPEHFSYVQGEQMGMIAQDIEKVFPDWVSENDGYKAVTFRGFEALTVESLRELRQEKDAEIAALKERLARMEAAISKLINSDEGGQL